MKNTNNSILITALLLFVVSMNAHGGNFTVTQSAIASGGGAGNGGGTFNVGAQTDNNRSPAALINAAPFDVFS